MEIKKVTDPEFAAYGKVLEGYDLGSLVKALADKTPLPETLEIQESDGTIRKLRTIGDRWSYLQRSKFGAQTQPFYVLIDHDARPLAPAYSYDENINRFVQWLESGLKKYRP